MNFNLIAILLAAVAVTFTAATDKSKLKNDKLAPAPPVRGGKKQHRSVSSVSNSASKTSHSSSSSVKKSRSSRPLSVLESLSRNEKTKICTRELEAILFSPPSTVKDYLSKIANEMRADIQIIMAAFAGGNFDYLRTYINKYNILITLYGAFGQPVLVASDFAAYTDYLKNVAVAQTYSGRDGFYVDTATQYYNYQFVLMSTNGQLISFILSLPLTSMTNTPTYCK